jgi:nucleotide-binding universal stress UspA family protein
MLMHVTHQDDKAYLQYVVSLAATYQAHLTALYLSLPPVPNPYVPNYLTPDIMEEYWQQDRLQCEQKKNELEALAKEMGVEVKWHSELGYTEPYLVYYGRYHDLIITNESKLAAVEPATAGISAAVAIATGRPVLRLAAEMQMNTALKRPLIAWKESREACRAVHDALPLLQNAERVLISVIGSEVQALRASSQRLAGYLITHGIQPEIEVTEEQEAKAGNLLLDLAAQENCDLLVMGAYGHSRLREFLFGGATRHMLHHAQLPILFAN